jgi:hypothetical protein
MGWAITNGNRHLSSSRTVILILQRHIPRNRCIKYPILQLWAHTITVSLRDYFIARSRLVPVVYNGHHNHKQGDDRSNCGALVPDDTLIRKDPSQGTHEAVIPSTARSITAQGMFLSPTDPPTDHPCYWIMLIRWNGICAERTELAGFFKIVYSSPLRE